MSDPTTLLLIACTSCLSETSNSIEPAIKNCAETQANPKDRQGKIQLTNCISPPEKIAAAPEVMSMSSGVLFQASDSLRAIFANLPTPTTTPKPLLVLGSRGSAVTEVQTKLQHLGYYSGIIDGIYGKMTRNAVSQFQQAKGLAVDGVIGDRTWGKLAKILTPSSPEEKETFIAPPEPAPVQQAETSQPTPERQLQLASLLGWVALISGGMGISIVLKVLQDSSSWEATLAGSEDYPLEDISDRELEEGDRSVMLPESPEFLK